MTRRSCIFVIVLILALMPFEVSAAAAASVDDIAVSVETRGSTVIIDLEVPIDVSPEEAWPTLVDYDHMSEFIPSITVSRVLSRNGNHLRIEQRGLMQRGPLSFSFDNVRDVQLSPPHEIRTRLVSGSLRAAESVTRIERTERGMRLVNHGEYTVNPLLPVAMVRQQIAAETRDQFALLRAEVLRRHARIATR